MRLTLVTGVAGCAAVVISAMPSLLDSAPEHPRRPRQRRSPSPYGCRHGRQA